MDGEFFQKVFQHSSVAALLAGRDGAEVMANPAFQALALFPPGGLKEILAGCPPLQSAFHEADRGNRSRIVLGRPWFSREHSVAVTRVSPSGDPALYLLEFPGSLEEGFFREALAESEQRYYRLQQNLPVGIYRANETGILETANPALIRMAGFDSFEELQAMKLEDVWVDPRDRDVLIDRLRAEGAVLGFTVRLKKKNGEEYIGSFDAHGTFDRDGRLLHFDTIVQDITEKVRVQKELERLATTDGLTGVCNRQHLLGRLASELKRAVRYGTPVSMLLMDLDYFKAVNDTQGHLCGDRVLREAAQRIAGALRGSDFVGRYGGEEFCVVLPEMAPAGARRVAEKLREAVKALPDPAPTISIGVSLWEPSSSVDDILGRADESLYRAKEAGRDRVEVYGDYDRSDQ